MGYSAGLEEGRRQVLTTVYIDVEVQAVPMEFTPATITHDFGTQTVTLSSATPHYFDAQAQTLPTVGMCHFETQTSPPPEIIHIPCTVNTDMPPPAVNANPTILYTSQHVINNSSDSLDWADDTAANIPIYPASPTRDWSALRPTSTQPFSTLQRRAKYHRQARLVSPRVPITAPFITRRHPAGIAPGRPVITVPVPSQHLPVIATSHSVPPSTAIPNLNWDQDPRLADLSRALRALGWVPP